jgi:antitoxin ParD1/3/4
MPRGHSPRPCNRSRQFSQKPGCRVRVFLCYMIFMTITLTREQQALLSAYVARGDFSSIEEAARQLIDERITERAAEEADDVAWAEPYIHEARAAVARGDVLTLDEHKARNATRLAAIKG